MARDWTAGDSSGSTTLTDSDHLHPEHINELRTEVDASATVTGEETLTHKTLTSPVINTPTVVQGVTAMAAQAIDGTAGPVFTRTLAGDETFTQSGFTTGRFFLVKVKQGNGTTYEITWFAGITWITSGGTAPTQTTTTNGYTSYGFQCTGEDTFDGYLVATQ